MARIKDGVVEKLKEQVSLVDLVEAHGVKLKKKGKELIGLCPFHDDTSPSLIISPDKNLWHCMGACQEGGSVIDWVMKTEGVSLRHAVEILKKREHLDDEVKPIKRTSGQKPDYHFEIEKSADGQALLNQVIDFYHENLKKHPEGMEYLQERSLKNPEMLDNFKLGLSNRTLGYHLPAKNRQAGKEIRERLQKLGILRESGHEHFNGSLVIPIFDEKGDVAEIYGRKLRNDLHKGSTYHLYLPGPHRGVWNFSCLAASKEVILCEALIDAITFWCYGFRNVTSSYGINGFTKDHLEAFKKYGTEKVLIAYDRDDAGDHAAEILSHKLIAEGIDCFRVQFPMGLDANEYARQAQSVEKALNHIIQNAKWMGSGKKAINISDIQKEAAKKENEGPATVEPPSLPCDIQAEVKPKEIIIPIEDRRWRIRGLGKNNTYEVMKVNLQVAKADKFHIDSLDLYSAKNRTSYIKQAAAELEVDEEIVKKDLGKVLLKLEELQDEQIKTAIDPQKKEVVMSEEEKKQALELLKDSNLMERILRDFRTCGVVGEETNKIVGYLAAVSRKLDSPLAILIQSSSAAGKTWLMESVLAFVPGEEKVKYSAMTGQSLFYMGETNLQHKILAIVEEEGAERTRYALKLLQSEGELSIASTGKDPITGELMTKEYRVQGPVMIFSTTTNIDIDEELQNRCIILTVDESREQTRAIHQMQRERRTFEGLRQKKEKDSILKIHRNAQRLLRPLSIINPYARRLTFLDDKTRTRRDHEKYLSLIDSITFLNQYQREIRSSGCGDNGRPDQTIIVNLEDIELANRLANEVLGHSLDELPPQTRLFIGILEEMVRKECQQINVEQTDYRFTRRQICDYSKWSLTQVRLHLQRLIDHEYVLVHKGSRGYSFVYELLYKGEGKDGKPFLVGLIDVNKLRKPGRVKDYEKKEEGGDSKNDDFEKKLAEIKAKNDEYEKMFAELDEKKHSFDKKMAELEAQKKMYDGNLADLATKKGMYDGNLAGENGGLAGSKRGQNGVKTGGWRGGIKPLVNKVLPFFLEKNEEKSISG